MSIKVLYLPKQISGYAPGRFVDAVAVIAEDDVIILNNKLNCN